MDLGDPVVADLDPAPLVPANECDDPVDRPRQPLGRRVQELELTVGRVPYSIRCSSRGEVERRDQIVRRPVLFKLQPMAADPERAIRREPRSRRGVLPSEFR